MSSTEYLNYEGGKFSKSKGVGVFGTDAKETGIPADVWRFYVYYNRPEKSDALFTWKDFQEKVNAELIGNLGNLVNRSLQFVSRFYGGRLPAGQPDEKLWTEVKKAEEEIKGLLEKVELREAFHRIFALSSIGNKRFQDGEPWKGVKETPEATASLIWNLAYLVRDLAILASPYIPTTADRIAKTLGLGRHRLGGPRGSERHRDGGKAAAALCPAGGPADRRAARAVLRDAEGAQGRGGRGGSAAPVATPAEIAARFRATVDLRAARIVEIKRHPDAEKLYIETVDLGTEQRTIVSGLVPHYKEEELLGHTIVLVANLKPALLRGVESKGMLLAASGGQDAWRSSSWITPGPGTGSCSAAARPRNPLPRSTSTRFSPCPSRRTTAAWSSGTRHWNAPGNRWAPPGFRRAG